MQDDFREAALVLMGHGTTLNAESAAPVYQHCAELRRRGVFAQVHEAFWKQEPRVVDVLARLKTPRIFLVPFFISEGFFSEDVIPRALGFVLDKNGALIRTQEGPDQLRYYCRPVGTHPSMTQVLLSRAQAVIRQFPFPRPPKPGDTTLFVAGHGTEKNENSREVIERQVGLIAGMNLYAKVHAVYLEEDPRIPQCYQIAQTRNLVIVPFFISDGLHVQEDIPVLLGEPKRLVEERLKNQQPTWRNPSEKQGKRVWYAPSVGTDPRLAEIILERAREAAQPPSDAIPRVFSG